MSYDEMMYNDYISYLQDTSNSKCLAPECPNKAINSHITSKKVLKRLAKEGHVYWIKKEEKCGIKKAYTYPVFCGNHDMVLFKRIDNENYIIGDKEQQFLYLYRSLAGELVRTRRKIEFIKERHYITDGKNIMGFSKPPRYMLDAYLFLNKQFQCLTEALSSEGYEIIESLDIVFDAPYPICVGQFFSMEYDFYAYPIRDNRGISLSVFPQQGKTHIILSWFKEDSDTFQFISDIVVAANETDKRIILSMLILNGCTNIVYSIDYWNSLDKKMRKKILRLYTLEGIEEEINLFVD